MIHYYILAKAEKQKRGINMNRFCPICGGTLNEKGICQFCGYSEKSKVTHVDSAEHTEPITSEFENVQIADVCEVAFDCESIFNSSDWETEWKNVKLSANSVGIILTDLSKLADEQYVSLIEDYIESSKERGVDYYLLNVSSQAVKEIDSENCEEIVQLLKEVYSVAVPHYLFIIGDETVIPSIVWENKSEDGDETVKSDLAYITLDCDSPWDGKVYDFKNVTTVGRLPANDTTFNGVKKYMQTLTNHSAKNSISTFAYTAKVWQKTTDAEFAHLKPETISSPNYSIKQIFVESYNMDYFNKKIDGFDLLCFNLHGSDLTNAWYGQEDNLYPDAYDASYLPHNDGYVICAECCYGAKSKIGKKNQSILVSALHSGCMAFVGSSRIAYGCSDGTLNCADIIANSFTLNINNGQTFGLSFLNALDSLCYEDMDEEQIKTLAEFSLYGDPSGKLIDISDAEKEFHLVKSPKNKTDAKRSIKLMSCNSDAEIEHISNNGVTLMGYKSKGTLEIKKMVKKVNDKCSSFVNKNYKLYEDVQPSIYKVVGKSGFRAVYKKEFRDIYSVLKVHLDDNGKVKHTYLSK